MVAFFALEQSLLELIILITQNDLKLKKKLTTLLDAKEFGELSLLACENSHLLLANQDFESAYTLVIALLEHVSEKRSGIEAIVEPLVADEKANSLLKLKVLSNLFGFLEKDNQARFYIYSSILRSAIKWDEFGTVLPSLKQLDQFLKEWNVTEAEKSELFTLIYEVLSKDYPEQSIEYLIKILQLSINEQDESLAQKLIVETLPFPSYLAFDDIINLKAVKKVSKEPLGQLLSIFASKSLSDYQEFVSNSNLLTEFDLDEASLLLKMRLLEFTDFASKHAGKTIEFSQVAKVLAVEDEEVEYWVVEAMRRSLIKAKIDQLSNTIFINHSAKRVFEEKEWTQLKDRLNEWNKNLDECLSVINELTVQ